MHYGTIMEWRRHTVVYNEASREFVSQSEGANYAISFGDDDIISNPDFVGQRNPALDIATEFAMLASEPKEVFVKKVVDFISKYGMMGIPRNKKGPPRECRLDWMRETAEMLKVLEGLAYIKENPPLLGVPLLPEGDPNVILINIQWMVNEHLQETVYPNVFYDCKERGDGTADAFLRPSMKFHNLLGAMYFAVFQNLQGKIHMCDKCGAPFFSSPRRESKATKGFCKRCIEKARNKRRNDARVDKRHKRIRHNIGTKIDNQMRPKKGKSISPAGKRRLREWFREFEAEYKNKDSQTQTEELEAWTAGKRKELDALVKSLKANIKGV